MPVKVSQAVLDGIEAVRDSGATNMLDRPTVAQLCMDMNYPEAALWVNENRITLPSRTIQNIDIGLLARDVKGYLNQVYEDQARYVIFHQGKPVATVLPVPDLEMIKDLAVGGYVDNWVEWNRNIRDRLLWPPATAIDEEADDE